VTPQRAERIVVWTMRLLAAAFAVTGILFIAVPDGVIGTLDDVGSELGEFAAGPDSEQRLWIGLAFAYMLVITGIALLVQWDVARFRPLLLLLAAGKAASSLTAAAFFLADEDVFAYLLNFVVDGSLVAVALGCWAIAGRVEAAASAIPSRTGPAADDGPGAAPPGDERKRQPRAPAAPG
jgi:hypothetical protein